MVTFFAEQHRPGPSENEEEQEHEHENENTELFEVAIPQPGGISELLKSLTPRTEKLIAQLEVQEPHAHVNQHSPEPGPRNYPRFTTCENSASPHQHETHCQ